MGILAATFVNVQPQGKRKRKQFKPTDFIPDFEKAERKGKSWEQMLGMAKALGIGKITSDYDR